MEENVKKCTYCSKEFDDFREFHRHYLHWHAGREDLTIPCGLLGCNETFKKFSTLRSHLSRKHPNRIKSKENRWSSLLDDTYPNYDIENDNDDDNLCNDFQEVNSFSQQENHDNDCNPGCEDVDESTEGLNQRTENQVDEFGINEEKVSIARFISQLKYKNNDSDDIVRGFFNTLKEVAAIRVERSLQRVSEVLLDSAGINLSDFINVEEEINSIDYVVPVGSLKARSAGNSVVSRVVGEDCRGVKRGACKDCECEYFEYNNLQGIRCAYCGCVPTHHVKISAPDCNFLASRKPSNQNGTTIANIDVDKILDHSDTAVQDKIENLTSISIKTEQIDDEEPGPSSLSNDLLSANTSYDHVNQTLTNREIKRKQFFSPNELDNTMEFIVNDTESESDDDAQVMLSPDEQNYANSGDYTNTQIKAENIDNDVQDTSFTTAETQNILPPSELESVYSAIPLSWSEDIQFSLENGKLSTKQRSFMIRVISLNLRLMKKISTLHVTHAAIRAAELYPALRGTFDSSHVSLVQKLKTCIKNSRRNMKKAITTPKNVEKEETVSKNIKLMHLEMTKITKSMHVFHNGMDIARKSRMIEAKSMTISAMLQKYPVLRLKEILMREFSKIVNIPESVLIENWKQGLRKILQNLHLNFSTTVGDDLISLKILQMLPQWFKQRKTENRLLQIYAAGTQLNNIRSSVQNTPCLIRIGDPSISNFNLRCYVDNTLLYTARASEATMLLIASYWVFQVPYPTFIKPQLIFLAAVLFRENSSRLMLKDLSFYSSVTNLLAEADLA